MYMDFIRAALVRAVRTMAQVAVAQAGSNMVGITDLDWKAIASVAAASGVLSILNSIATGLPEVDATIPVITRGTGKHAG